MKTSFKWRSRTRVSGRNSNSASLCKRNLGRAVSMVLEPMESRLMMSEFPRRHGREQIWRDVVCEQCLGQLIDHLRDSSPPCKAATSGRVGARPRSGKSVGYPAAIRCRRITPVGAPATRGNIVIFLL